MTLILRRFLWVILSLVGGGLVIAEDKPKTDERLQHLLKRFPDADANKDGVLTQEEAQAYRKNLNAEGGKKQDGKTQDPTAADAFKPTQADVKYGPAERNVLDFYQAKSEKRAPLVIYIHGGGFVVGNKTVGPAQVKAFHDAGISLAAIHYRFVDGKDVIFPVPQHDSARALQFLRSKAKDWNIDPKRVACFGKQLRQKMDDLGIENVYVYTPDAKGRNVAAEMLEFFQKQFAKVK